MSTALAAGPHVLAFDFGWGHLQHHESPCEECDGSGVEYEDEDGGPAVDCTLCDGEKTRFWGSFYAIDEAACGTCKRDEVPVAEMYDGSYDDAWVCLPCYVQHHREVCKCARWAEAERAMLQSRTLGKDGSA